MYLFMLFINFAGSWIMLTFLGGEKYNNNICNNATRQAHIIFICDKKQNKLVLEVVDDYYHTLNCSLMFIIRHHSVCNMIAGGLSAGTIIFIILLVTFGCYFCFGFFYLRLVKGVKGIEQIPNREFWFKVGNLLADGCGAVFRCDRYCSGGVGTTSPGSYSGYSSIDENLAQDLQGTDRDSALLSP